MPRDISYTRPGAIEAGQTLEAAQLGRPPARYSLGVHQQICENIKKGNRPVTAAQMAGIPSSVFYRWMQMGKNGNLHLAQFVEDVDLALGHFESEMVKVVVEDAKEDAKTAQWTLERRYPEGFAKEVDAKVQGIITKFMAALRDGLTDDEYMKVLAVSSGFSGNEALLMTAGSDDDSEEPQDST